MVVSEVFAEESTSRGDTWGGALANRQNYHDLVAALAFIFQLTCCLLQLTFVLSTRARARVA